MLRYLVRRLLWAAVLAVLVTAVAYVVFFVVPSDPARRACGQRPTAGCVGRARARLGLDSPIYVRYGRFLERLVLDGDLGRSFADRRSVDGIVARAAPVTASLVLGGAVLWLLVAVPLGVASALRPRSLLDRAGTVVSLIGICAHPIWIGLVLAYLVGYRLGLTPITGYCDFLGASGGCGGPVQWAYHLILPWVTFAFLYAGLYVRMIRASVVEALHADHVRTARAKGAPGWVVLRSHVLRNALLPVVAMLGMDVGVGLGGVVFTETVYGLPGLGRTLVQSIERFDLPVTTGIVLFASLAVIAAGLVVDLVSAWVDPRVRLS